MLSRLTAEMCDAEVFLATTAVVSDSVQGSHLGLCPDRHLGPDASGDVFG